MEEKVIEVLATIFNIDPSEINDSSSPDTIENWDSLNKMNLVVALEEEFNIELSDEEIIEMANVKLIKMVIKSKLEK